MKECCRAYLADQFGGDEDVMAEIYAEYVTATGLKISEAKAALAAGDLAQLDRVAHTMKGNSLAAGDTAMADVAIALRKCASLSDTAACQERIAELESLSGTL